MVPIKDKLYWVEYIAENKNFDGYVGRVRYTGEIEDSDEFDRLYWCELLDGRDDENSRKYTFFYGDDIVREIV